MLVIQKETRQTLAHFLTDTLAIVGGVLTMAGLIVGPSLLALGAPWLMSGSIYRTLWSMSDDRESRVAKAAKG